MTSKSNSDNRQVSDEQIIQFLQNKNRLPEEVARYLEKENKVEESDIQKRCYELGRTLKLDEDKRAWGRLL